jgi:predicted acylesterase/phospholipase RssA
VTDTVLARRFVSIGGARTTLVEGSRIRDLSWADVAELPWDDFDLVLGAGGMTAASFEVGTLLALSVDWGVDLSRVNQIVGTSAGSIIATLIALGFDGQSLAALAAAAHHHIPSELQRYATSYPPNLPPAPNPFNLVRLQSPGDLMTSVALLVKGRYGAAMVNTLRKGTFDLAEQARYLQGVGWHELRADLSICSTSTATGDRLVVAKQSNVPLIDAEWRRAPFPPSCDPSRSRTRPTSMALSAHRPTPMLCCHRTPPGWR